MTVQEIDFSLVEDKAESKVFRFLNADSSVYDMTDSTASCKLYLDPDSPLSITCSIDVPTGKITVPFTAVHSDDQGTFEYIIEEDVGGLGDIIPLVKGNIFVLPYTPFSESIEAYLRSELPANLTITMDYRNQRIMFWRRILQGAFNIADMDINVEAAWPTLVNALLAKLVVYDALMLAASGSFVQFLGGGYTESTSIGGGGIKSVETGPTKVEYYDTASSAKQAFAASAGNISMFEALREGLCGLTNFLQVKLHICKGNDIIIVPKYYQNPDWAYPTLSDHVGYSFGDTESVPDPEIIGQTLLIDGNSTYINVGNIIEHTSIHIAYVVTRGAARQEGILRILYDGATVSILDDFQDNGMSPEVTFTTDIDGNSIRLIGTLTSTGTNALFWGEIQRL